MFNTGFFSSLFIDAAVIVGISLWYRVVKHNLTMLQQNSYRPERYMRWLRASGITTSVPAILSYLALLFSVSMFATPLVAGIVICAVEVYLCLKLNGITYKKPLANTGRVKRLRYTMYALAAVVMAVALLLTHKDGLSARVWALAVALLGCYCASHVLTLAALYIMKPVDNAINRKFYRQAQNRLQSMPDLKIVGITGSYGKTSTKHYLHRILSEHYDTLMTPGSFNTTLGVVRTVNEHLKPYNEVFIVEMGAKQKGDIAEICQLVNPTIGIITAVGPQHLETFGSIENVRDTKFELADALPADGLAIINNDFEQIRGRKVSNAACSRYGVSHPEGCEYTAKDIRYTPRGTEFTVTDGKWSLPLSTSLLGECNISNLVAAVIVAKQLDVPDSKIKYAVAAIEPVEHRLSLKRLPSGLTIIDDAFNSNPVGSAMALDVLAMMTQGTRILITPGMIELGSEQERLNTEFGRKAASCCDVACVVCHYNRDAIVAGLKEGGMDEKNILTFANFNEAFAYVSTNYGNGATVLIENDLPDTFK